MAAGVRESRVRWSEAGDAEPRTEACHGDKDWIVRSSGDSDAANCVFVQP